jgi:hyperosmotically inducible protein
MENNAFNPRAGVRLGLLGLALTTLLAAQPGTGSPMTDEEVLRISRQIQKEVVTLSNYGLFDDIRFSIKGREVILWGSVSRPTLKSSVEQVTKRIEGVEKVTNQLEVQPLSRFDDEIRARVYVAIYGHPALERYNPNRGTPLFRSRISVVTGITNDPPIGFHPVHIIVKNGNVTLEGVMDSVGDRSIAELQANRVPNVFKVTNNIQVANQERMSDMSTKAKKSK